MSNIYFGLRHEPDNNSYRDVVRNHMRLGGVVSDRPHLLEPRDSAIRSPLRTEAFPDGAPPPPDGYRYLLPGEVITKGCEFFSKFYNAWEGTTSWGVRLHKTFPGLYATPIEESATPVKSKPEIRCVPSHMVLKRSDGDGTLLSIEHIDEGHGVYFRISTDDDVSSICVDPEELRALVDAADRMIQEWKLEGMDHADVERHVDAADRMIQEWKDDVAE